MTLVIMAAGMGSRFGGLKQIEPFGPNGEFLIDYSIYDAKRVGFDKVVFIIKEENYELFKKTIGQRVEDKITTSYVFQKNNEKLMPADRIKPYGTGHAIMACETAVNEPFAIVNADDFYGYDGFLKISQHLKTLTKDSTSYGLVTYQAVNTMTENGAVKRGICDVKNGYLLNLTESSLEYVAGQVQATNLNNNEAKIIPADSPVSMNLFALTPAIFTSLKDKWSEFLKQDDLLNKEFIITDIISADLTNQVATMKAITTNAIWHGVTYKEDKENVVNAINNLIEKGEYPLNLWG